MRIDELQGKTICLIGFGIENRATLRAIDLYAPDALVSIADVQPLRDIPVRANQQPVGLQTGPGYLQNLDRFDVLIKTPGIPPRPELDALHSKLTSATQIFLESVHASGSIVVGMTGTKGKSTTSSLIAAMLKRGGKDVHLVGNIGIPTLDFLEDAKENTIFVQEMSSYQLSDISVSPPIAVITSIFPDHLDYHGSYDAYMEAKKNIARFQGEDDTVFFANIPQATQAIAECSPGKKVPYSEEDSPVAIHETRLIGMHNQRNIGGAWRVAEFLGVARDAAISAAKEFHGLPHRLQNLGIRQGIEWVDDAISTTPESTIAAMHALGSELETMILGGQDRGYDFAELGKEIAQSAVLTVILLPESGARIREAIENAGAKNVRCRSVATMEEAVALAKDYTEAGNICLLSPASPSYNQFRNFEEKAEMFRKAIEAPRRRF